MYQTKRFGSVSEYEAWVASLGQDVSNVSAFAHGFHVIATYFDPSVQPIPAPLPAPTPVSAPEEDSDSSTDESSDSGKPSAEDLDADAEEKKAEQATS